MKKDEKNSALVKELETTYSKILGSKKEVKVEDVQVQVDVMSPSGTPMMRPPPLQDVKAKVSSSDRLCTSSTVRQASDSDPEQAEVSSEIDQ